MIAENRVLTETFAHPNPHSDLSKIGLTTAKAHWNLSPAACIEQAVRRAEGEITAAGPFNAVTSPHTGRSPKDRFIVHEGSTESDVWWGPVNAAFEPQKFEILRGKVVEYLQGQELFVRDVYACADPQYRLRVRFVSTTAWHSLFVHNMFIRPPAEELKDFVPDFTVLHAPEMQANPEVDGTRSGAFVILNFAERLALIGGTRYAGELKKSIFTLLNYLLPEQDVLSMHCSANVGDDGRSALFFGLSGTGKTTLSTDPSRALVGDDEHGWSERGVFNLEGGCYAKVIRLSEEVEPDIYAATCRFGTVLENVVVDSETRALDLDNDSITENTRAAYPIYFNQNIEASGMGGHPRNVVFLTADAWGVLPPIARLTRDQARYYFLSGYTAKLAGTESGVVDPQATFSACFGSPFLIWHPSVYADMLARKIAKHRATVWLVNTGWTGGPFGVGQRMKIGYTRAMVNAVANGDLTDVPTEPDEVFGVAIPKSVPGVPDEVLRPRSTWADKDAYDLRAYDLAVRFHENFEQFAAHVSPEVRAAGPIILN